MRAVFERRRPFFC